MLGELRDSFREKDLDKLILDSYIPADGTYLLLKFNENNEFEKFLTVNIKLDKKTRDIDRTIEKLDVISCLDYNSKLLDMNKPIDGKKVIHSNNYLSFFVKKESLLLDKSGNRKLTEEIIENYYEILKNPSLKYEKKNKSKEIYETIENDIGKVDLDKLNKVKEWIKENIFSLDIDFTKKDYLKILFLFKEGEKDFIREGKRYTIPNIFNSNDFNVRINNNILGVPNDNMGLNAKKPYLENKTRKITAPNLLDQEEVLLQKKVLDYLYNLASMGYNNIYIDEEIHYKKNNEKIEKDFAGIYFRIQKGKELEIHEFDVISAYKEKLGKKFIYKNFLDNDYELLYKSYTGQYGEKNTLTDIELLIDEVLFSKYLKNSYHGEKLSINDSILKQSILLARNKLFQWFYKGNDNNLWSLLEKISSLAIRNTIEKGNMIKVMNQFNLKYSLKNYFLLGGEDMAEIISTIKGKLRIKISEKDTKVIESDEEYFFAVGQVLYHLLSKSKSKNKPMSLINPIVEGKKDEKIKEKVGLLFSRYNYDMSLDKDRRFKNLYSMILTYKPDGKINKDLIIAGVLSSSLIYEKKENKDNDE